MTYQKTLKLLGLCDVNPAVFLNDFDVFYFVIESEKQTPQVNHQEEQTLFTAVIGLNIFCFTITYCCAFTLMRLWDNVLKLLSTLNILLYT